MRYILTALRVLWHGVPMLLNATNAVQSTMTVFPNNNPKATVAIMVANAALKVAAANHPNAAPVLEAFQQAAKIALTPTATPNGK